VGRGRLIGIASGIAAALIWGSFPVVTRIGVTDQSLDPWDMAFIRFVVAALVTLPILLRRGFFCHPRRALPILVIGIGFPYILVITEGLVEAPVQQFAAITPASMIGFSTLVVSLLRRRMPAWPVLLGVTVILLGVALTALSSLMESGAGPLRSYFLFILGALMWSAYTVTTREIDISALQATALVSFWSAAVYSPFYLAFKGTVLFDQVAPATIATQAVYQGLLVSVIALFLYSKAVENLGVIAGSVFAALVPGFATLYAVIFLQERPGPLAIASVVAVSFGMIVTLAASRKRRSKRS